MQSAFQLILVMLSAHPYLDYRNINIWKELSKALTISVTYHDEKSYGLYRINNSVNIYVPHLPPCKDSFTHELLHLWLDMNDVSVSRTLSSTFKTDQLFKFLFKPELGDHLGNCADHYKMLPLYLNMGFERNKFLQDYDSIKCSDIALTMIEGWYNHEDYPSQQYAVEQYLAIFFSMKACPNPKFDYEESLNRLNKLDSQIYEILETFWVALDNFDVNNADSVFNSYRQFSYPFTENLKQHLVKKFLN